MPKITIKKFVIAGQLKEFGIWYTDTDKFFIKDFDSNVGGTYNWRKFGYGCETQAELYEKALAAIKEYEEAIAESKKVILLKLTAAKPHLEKYSNGYRDYDPNWLNHFYNNDTQNMGFEIQYEVKMFRKVGDKNEFYEVIDGKMCNRESIPNLTAYQIIDWTQEKEDALNSLQTMFGNLLDKFVKAMKEPEKFINAINSQKLLA